MGDSIRVTLTVSDWQRVPVRTYSRVIEFEREDWDDWSPLTREREIDDELRQFVQDTFSANFEIENGSLDDPNR